jgi:WD40 repeat protein
MLRQGLDESTPRPRHWSRWALTLAAGCAVLAGVSRLAGAAGEAKPAGGGEKAKARADLHGDPLPSGALARLGTLRWRHGAAITYVAFTPDRKALLTAAQDNSLRLWDLKTGKEIRRFEKAPAAGAVAFNPGYGNGSGVALSPDGKTLATIIRFDRVQLWDVTTGKELREIAVPPGNVNSLVFSPDSKTLAGRGYQPTTRLWEVATGKELRQFTAAANNPGGGGVVFVGGAGGPNLAFSPDGKLLVAPHSFFANPNIKTSFVFWETATGKEVRQLKIDQPGGVSTFACSPDGKVLAYGSGAAVHLIAADTGKELSNIQGQRFGLNALIFSPDSKTLAVKSPYDPQVRLYETATGKLRLALGQPPALNNGGIVFWGGLAMGNLAFSPDGKQLAVGGSNAVQMWDTLTGQEAGLPGGHRGEVTDLAVLAGGLVATKGADNTVRLWDAATGKERHQFLAPAGASRIAFTRDGKLAALSHPDGSVRLHEAATGKEVRRLKGHQNGVAAVAFSPDGKTVASRGTADNTIRLSEVATGKELRAIAPKFLKDGPANPGVIIIGGYNMPGVGLVFSADGKTLVSPGFNGQNNAGFGMPIPPGGLRNTLNFWDVATGKELHKIELPQNPQVLGFALSPDGRTLATEHQDHSVTVWEIASGKERARLGAGPGVQPIQPGIRIGGFNPFGMAGGSTTIAFAPDGRRLVVRGPGAVVLWDPAAGKQLGRLQGHAGDVTALAFAPDGKTLISGGRDTTSLVWDATGLQPEAKPQPVEMKPAEVEALWNDLVGLDAVRAYQGIRKLTAAPKQAVAILGEKLKPAPQPDVTKLDKWLTDLDARKFALRDRATRELEKLGELAVPALQKVLTGKPPLETRQRVERLLEKLTGTALSVEQLRVVRALEVLEQVGTPEARKVLENLARGAPGALPTREAQTVLRRLGKPAPAQP